jgi:hypothetical protein
MRLMETHNERKNIVSDAGLLTQFRIIGAELRKTDAE